MCYKGHTGSMGWSSGTPQWIIDIIMFRNIKYDEDIKKSMANHIFDFETIDESYKKIDSALFELHKIKNEDKMIKKEMYVKCECGTEVLNIVSNIDNVTQKDDEGIETIIPIHTYDLAIFSFDNHIPPLWYRIKLAYKLLVKGSIFTDQTIMSEENMIKIKEFIDNTTK